MQLRSKVSRIEIGDLVLVSGLNETGIVVEPPYVGQGWYERIGIMLTDTEGVVVKVKADGCQLISRSLGSPCQPSPFPDELLIEKGPKVEKFSSENFQELSTLTIDEELY